MTSNGKDRRIGILLNIDTGSKVSSVRWRLSCSGEHLDRVQVGEADDDHLAGTGVHDAGLQQLIAPDEFPCTVSTIFE